MPAKYTSVDEYISLLPEERLPAINKLRQVILKNLPKGFSEEMSYNMPSYVVPHSLYPNGYHCDPKVALPFMGFASQKGGISFYHMGIYADKKLQDWFVQNYAKHTKTKLDMGKSCIRFKKIDDIPFALIGELVAKVSVNEWVACYEKNLKK